MRPMSLDHLFILTNLRNPTDTDPIRAALVVKAHIDVAIMLNLVEFWTGIVSQKDEVEAMVTVFGCAWRHSPRMHIAR